MVKSVLAVIAGFALWSILWLGSNAAMAQVFASKFQEDGSTESGAILAAFLVISLSCSVLAGFLTARLANRAPMKHVLILGIIQVVIGIAVQAQYWELLPIWYHLIFLLLLLPGHLLGGQLCVDRRNKTAGICRVKELGGSESCSWQHQQRPLGSRIEEVKHDIVIDVWTIDNGRDRDLLESPARTIGDRLGCLASRPTAE